MDVSFSRKKVVSKRNYFKTDPNLPIAFKLGADGTGAGTPEVIADDPIALILEHTFVE
jgi:hypothetical protein